MNSRDTIVAISTPLGRSGIGIVRLSGERSRAIAQTILTLPQGTDWRPWTAQLGALVDEAGSAVDQVVASLFAAPRSYTGEDVVEISCHGAPVVLQFCLSAAVRAGARVAEPGEFTLRAYMNGRIDLPQAEAVRDLIEATTLYQARVAVQQMHGSASKRIGPIKTQLLELIALLEAGIDFAEDDISVAPSHEILRRLAPIEHAVAGWLNTYATGRLVFEGFTLAIVGRPNVGKSSLFNRLLEQDRAIVTDIPGTTRDLVSERITMAGLPVKLVDTAGIREGTDLVETLGIERAYQAMADADLTLLLIDASAPLMAEDEALLARFGERTPLLVANKSDLPRVLFLPEGALAVSAVNGDGIEALRTAILDRLAPGGLPAPESGSITNVRHEALLRETATALAAARAAVEYAIPHEMLLLDLYAALRPLDGITGATTADDILNRIFSTFCIGK